MPPGTCGLCINCQYRYLIAVLFIPNTAGTVGSQYAWRCMQAVALHYSAFSSCFFYPGEICRHRTCQLRTKRADSRRSPLQASPSLSPRSSANRRLVACCRYTRSPRHLATPWQNSLLKVIIQEDRGCHFLQF